MFKTFSLIFILALLGAVYFYSKPEKSLATPRTLGAFKESVNQLPSPNPSPKIKIPDSKILNNDYQVFQSFNNCGPAALSMALSYYGIHKSQDELASQLRPYQVPGGDNDDKSVSLEEVAAKAQEFGLIPYLRPNGNIKIIKQFIASGIPVITRTWLKPDEDIGHYRIIKGYDDNLQQLTQDDSMQGKNLKYSYDEFNNIWDKFNYEYLVLVPEDKKQLAEQIIGEDLDEKTAWQKAVRLSEDQLDKNPQDLTAGFNLSAALYKTGDYKKSVAEFEKIQNQLSFRTLWYQDEPILALYELGEYDKVFEITDKILNNQNRAYSELYLIRGNIDLKQGNKEAAKSEFEKAVFYNKNLKEATTALKSVS